MTGAQKKTKFRKGIPALVCACVTMHFASAQVHAPFQSNTNWLRKSELLNDQKLFKAAAYAADASLSGKLPYYLQDNPLLDSDRARFLRQVSALKSGDSSRLPQNIQHPAYQQRLALAKARLLFRQKKWSEAAECYATAGISNLSNAEVAASKFERAYALFNDHQFDAAESILASVKDIPGDYAAPARYYYGLLAYNRGRYDDALQSFRSIETNDIYGNVVPYYIAEIHYFKGEPEIALQKAEEELAKARVSYYDKELRLLAAQCLFEKQKYRESLPYFEAYYAKSDKIRKQDLYEMAYAYYRSGQHLKAVEPFTQLSGSQDSLGQTAMYFLGDCFLQTGNKRGAKNAFALAGSMPYQPEIAEHATLLSGKLAFELGYASEGMQQLKRLLQDFPAGKDRKEAKELLSAQLLQTGSYEDAYLVLKEGDEVSPDLVQQAAYSLALARLQQKNYSGAAALLDEAIAQNIGGPYLAAAHFWRAETAYQLKNYRDALRHGEEFLKLYTPDTKKVAPNISVQQAFSTLGYAALQTEDFSNSTKYFAQAQSKNENDGYSGKVAADAALREADAAFLAKDYATAITLYDKLINAKGVDAEYALFQKSTLLGLLGKSTEQADILLKIIAQRNPPSQYLPEAHYALGDLLLEANKFEDAIGHFEKINDQNAKHLASKALIKIAFAYQEAENNVKAIEYYQSVIKKYPGSEEKQSALDGLKSMYVATNKPDAYLQFLRDNNLLAEGGANSDSLFYQAEESQYIAGKYSEAVVAMRKYLSAFNNGLFVVKAHYYGAESFLQLKQADSAIVHFEQVLKSGWSDFTEPATLKAATISYSKENYAAAEQYYGLLRNTSMSKTGMETAYRGMMLSADKLGSEKAVRYADTLLAMPDINEALKSEIALVKGNAASKSGNYSEAADQYRIALTSKDIDVAAEANYQSARIPLLQKDLNKAEAAANEAIKASAGNSYWNTKSYLLMSDVFIAQKDYFNARATLQSIIRNVKTESLRQEAQKRLDSLKQLEKGKSKINEGE
jgi:TolA-binding protein